VSRTLIAAPTGSGKTLAAFLTAIDDLVREGLRTPLPDEVRVLYVSPLKALSTDIHRNLAEPRRGIRDLAAASGLDVPRITAAVRTGDTPAGERAAMLRTPPHILVTTPESLYLLLTAERSRERLRTVRTVIVDEIHAVDRHAARGAPRAVARAARGAVRRGRGRTAGRAAPPRAAAADRALGHAEARRDRGAIPGRRSRARGGCTIVDEGHRRALDLEIEIPRSPLEAVLAHEVWEEYYDRLAELIGQHRTTLVFVNTRRQAERIARHLSERLGEDAVTAHHGSLARRRGSTPSTA
jgi:ATP-dependent helicase Lhr and Lhr-like helicase